MPRFSASTFLHLLAVPVVMSFAPAWAATPEVSNSTATVLGLSPDPSIFSENVFLTATVTAFDGGTPTGTVSFDDDANLLVANVPMNGNVATFSTSSLSVGVHKLSAHYNGDMTYTPSTGLNTQTVGPDEIFAGGFDPTTFTLAITNYLAWCSISENGSPFSPSMSFPRGSVVALHGDAVNGTFVWGYWTGTDADTGSNDTQKDATVTMSSDRSVLACCPFATSPGMTCN